MRRMDTRYGSVDLENLTIRDIRIGDIAHSLGQIARFNGMARKFYSVAEHCCHLHDYAIVSAADDTAAFDSLMHDAAEAYVGDTISPLKTEAHAVMEKQVMSLIRRKWNIVESELTAEADQLIINDEMSQLFPNRGYVMRLGVHVNCWSWLKAKAEFMARFKQHRDM